MKQSNSSSKRESRRVWAQRYQQWQVSGLSKIRYCKQHNIKSTCFYFWCAVFRKQPPSLSNPTGARRAKIKPAFVPVTLRASSPQLVLQCGEVTLRCSSDICDEQLTRWIKTLKAGACSR